jgi:hypothetical protein
MEDWRIHDLALSKDSGHEDQEVRRVKVLHEADYQEQQRYLESASATKHLCETHRDLPMIPHDGAAGHTPFHEEWARPRFQS